MPGNRSGTKLVLIILSYPDYDECTNTPCENGGTCINGKGSFRCVCPRNYRGSRCEGKYGSENSLSDIYLKVVDK